MLCHNKMCVATSDFCTCVCIMQPKAPSGDQGQTARALYDYQAGKKIKVDMVISWSLVML